MTRAVRKEIKFGSDWIKILATGEVYPYSFDNLVIVCSHTGAFMSASTGPKDSPENTHFAPEELRAVVMEASRRQVSQSA